MGVIILTILYVLVAIVWFVMAALLMAAAIAEEGMSGLSTAPLLLFGVFFLLLFGVFFLLVAFGIYAMKAWAWTVGLVVAILGLLGGAAGAASGQYASIVNLILNLIIIIYLFKVKEYFR